MMPSGMRREARPEVLMRHVVLAGFETPSSGIYAVYPTNRLMTPVIREFVGHVIGESHSRGVPT